MYLTYSHSGHIEEYKFGLDQFYIMHIHFYRAQYRKSYYTRNDVDGSLVNNLAFFFVLYSNLDHHSFSTNIDFVYFTAVIH